MKNLKIFGLLIFTVFGLQTFASNDVILNQLARKGAESGSDSLVIVQNGQTVYSNFFGGADRVQNVQSVTKSICSLAIGILLDEGQITSLDAPMSTWYSEWAQDTQKSKITLRMIMNHTSGISDKSVTKLFGTPDYVAVARQTPVTTQPGTYFEYSNVGVTLLQKVIADAAGVTLHEYVRAKLHRPMGITGDEWIKDKVGHEGTSGGAALSTADLIKIGQLILNKGKFNGRQIIKSSTLATLTTKSQAFDDYGLLWWLNKQSPSGARAGQVITAWGWGGQFIVIYPAKNLVGVRTRNPFAIELEKFDAQAFSEFRDLLADWE